MSDMSDLYDQVIFALNSLQNKNTLKYIEACHFLLSLEKTSSFYNIVSHYFRHPEKIENFIKTLTVNSQLTGNHCNSNMPLDDNYKAATNLQMSVVDAVITKNTKFLSLQQNSLSEEIQISHTNLRACSSALILHFTSLFGHSFLNYLLPFLWKNLFLNSNFKKMEAGIFLFNKIRSELSDRVFLFPCFVARLLDYMNKDNILLQVPTVFTLANCTKICTNLHDSQFLEPLFQNIPEILLSSNTHLQEVTCFLILKLIFYFGNYLQKFTPKLSICVNSAYNNSQNKSLWLIRAKNACTKYNT